MIVCKFGGSSLADSGQIKKVKRIIESDSRRRFIVVSAPGKRDNDDIKITDLLYTCEKEASSGRSMEDTFRRIEERFSGICNDLEIDIDLKSDLDEIKKNILSGSGPDYAASRGEYLSAKILGTFFTAEFIDAADVIRLTDDGLVDSSSYELIKERVLDGKRYILPGFFGTDSNGRIKTFSRGGSDISGAIAAHAVGAEMYENWTDVSGLLMADPRIFNNPPVVEKITYREIRELAFIGANVFHEEAIAPVKDSGIPINIRNTNDPESPGTIIASSRQSEAFPVAGISGKLAYTAVYLEKFMLNRFDLFHSDVLRVFRNCGSSPDFIFYGNDSVVFLTDEKKISDLSFLKKELLSSTGSDIVKVKKNIGIIGVVGEGIGVKAGIGARILGALDKNGINIPFVSFGGSEITFLIGVEEKDYSSALGAAYTALIQY